MKNKVFIIVLFLIVMLVVFPKYVIMLLMVLAIYIFCLVIDFSWSSLIHCLEADRCVDHGGIWVQKYERCCFDPGVADKDKKDHACLDLIEKYPHDFKKDIEEQIKDIRERLNRERKNRSE
ncbi:MAG: hypothetical protein H7833_14525 [Magnetococcus sp. DMHC-1]